MVLPTKQWFPCARSPSMVGEQTFRFLSVVRSITAPNDWTRADWPKLWRYNLHYFDDLVADAAYERAAWHRAWLERWIAENTPGKGDGWEPYPTSLRIVNWLKWLMAGNEPVPGMIDSLAVQVRWLLHRLEFHLLGNHLWANAKALVFAGVVFQGEEGERWLRTGLSLFRKELPEQVLPDGGHFERSPMYHAIMTEDLLDLIQLAQVSGRLGNEVWSWRAAAERMLIWAATMSHPDGEVAFFNDAAFGIAPSWPVLQDYARKLGLGVPKPPSEGITFLRDSGYCRLQNGSAVLLADVAPIGPDYLPGHAHADTLSFELSIHGQRILVNGGTSTYENDTDRHQQRATASHNTVVVDGQDSSEVWASFRVARRARVHDVECGQTESQLTLSAWHDGYLRLPGRVRHHRRWELGPNVLVVEDRLSGRFDRAEAHFLFAPGVAHDLNWQVSGGEGRVVDANWYPRFGESVMTKKLVVRFFEPHCAVRFSWER